MSEKLPVSVVMIAHNEAERLPHSLGSVAGWVSEIIVVINDCVDDTAAVAARYGATVSEHPFENFRDQKRYALKLARQPWVLILDADEVVSPKLRMEMVSFFKHPPPEVNGVWFARRLWFMGRWIRHGDSYPDRVLRLFRRAEACIGGVPEHDKTLVRGRTLRFRHDLLHYSFDSIADQVNKISFFAEHFVQRSLEKNKRFSWLETSLRVWWRFFRAYFLRGGFLDGFPGFYLAYFTSFYTLIRYARLYEYLHLNKIAGDGKILGNDLKNSKQ
ncbi:MAG: glycosyltransferase family 2 protein [Verrucomicrobiales bacterium]|jgi:glycosyltransferase involved in cell wall biosynthesis|nr:glycosyltransferase family 2 protein [Verrucomicrobiales bacterium]